MKINKNYINVSIGIILIIILGYVFVSCRVKPVEFQDLSYEIDEIMNSTKIAPNNTKDGNKFYLPKGYKILEEKGLILSDGLNIFQLYVDENSTTSLDENSIINKDKEILFQKTFFNNEKIEIYVWQEDNDYLEVLISERGSYIVGDIKENKIKEKMIDMANILHSVK